MNEFTIIGVTGTDGKTTTSKMIYDTITEKYKAIYIGTLGIISADYELETINTTPDIETILETFKYAKENNIKFLVIECSSEGLLQKRLTGIRFDVSVFTNLTHEHLNTHKTIENYFYCKKKLLKLVKKNGVVISNQEDYYGRKFIGNKNINYGLHKGKVHTISFSLDSNKTSLLIMNDEHLFHYEIPFVGVYNIYNFLAAHATISLILNIKKSP